MRTTHPGVLDSGYDRPFLVSNGAVGGGTFGIVGQANAQYFAGIEAKKAAKKNRAFQRKMSNTQYTRAMRDMRNAGLNPILAYKQGGAGNLSGAVAQVPDYGKIVNTAIEGSKVGSQKALMKAQVGNVIQQTATSAANADFLTKKAEMIGPLSTLMGGLERMFAEPFVKKIEDAGSGKQAEGIRIGTLPAYGDVIKFIQQIMGMKESINSAESVQRNQENFK